MRLVSPLPDLQQLLPHRGIMLLLDRLTALDGDTVQAVALVRPDWPLHDQALEYVFQVELVAQTVCCWYGWRLGPQSENQIGYLVGIKSAEFRADRFQTGQVMEITAQRLYMLGGYGVFKGEVRSNGDTWCSATVQVIDPLNRELGPEGERDDR